MPHLAIETYISQIFWLVILFGTLYALIARVFLPSISQVLDSRAQHIMDDIDKAETMKNETSDVEYVHEQTQLKATLDAKKVLDEATAKVEKKMQEKRNELQMKIDRSLLDAEKKIIQIETESSRVVQKISDDISKIMAEKLVA